MSYSALYQVYGTTVKTVEEFRNGHGSGPPVWEWVAQMYCGKPKDAYIFAGLGGDGWMSKVFKRETVQALPEQWASVLMFTADFAVIEDGRRKEFAGHCAAVHQELDTWTEWGPGKVNHWKAVGEAVLKAKATKRSLGLGLTCTSVSDIWMDYSSAKGKGYEERRFRVFEYLESIRKAAA